MFAYTVNAVSGHKKYLQSFVGNSEIEKFNNKNIKS